MDLGSQVLAVDPIQIAEDVTVPKRDSDLSAWVNVIFGCNERCTYCVVPNTRGREQSRQPDAILVSRPALRKSVSDDLRAGVFQACKAGNANMMQQNCSEESEYRKIQQHQN